MDLLERGDEFFPRLISAIDSAQDSIELETYIFANDTIGHSVFQSLVRARLRGVSIRVIIDWLGTGHRECQKWHRQFAAHDLQLQSFNSFFRRGLVRTHRKIAIIDKRLGFVGGINIKDDLNAGKGRPPLIAPRWDFAVCLHGQVVRTILLSFESQWGSITPFEKGRRQWRYLKEVMRQSIHRSPAKSAHHQALCSYITRDNFKRRNAIQRAYLTAIQNAQNSILLVTPYFAPGRRFRLSLMNAAQRGVDVKLLIGVGEIQFQDWVTRSFYPLLIKSGVRIMEYQKTLLHAKVAVIDENWVTLGSSNCDALSLFINQEANLIIKEVSFARALKAKISFALQESKELLLHDYLERNIIKRMFYRLSYITYRTAMRIVTRGEYR